MAGCNKNTPNNNNQSQKMTKGTQAPPTQMRKFDNIVVVIGVKCMILTKMQLNQP